MTGSEPDTLARVTPAILHIGLALSAGPLHGYAIMQEVDRLTLGRVRLGPGTLYRTIQRMQKDGVITELENRPVAADDDERRRYYQLTRFGRRILREEALRLQDFVRLARRRGLLAAAQQRSAAAGQRS